MTLHTALTLLMPFLDLNTLCPHRVENAHCLSLSAPLAERRNLSQPTEMWRRGNRSLTLGRKANDAGISLVPLTTAIASVSPLYLSLDAIPIEKHFLHNLDITSSLFLVSTSSHIHCPISS